MTARYDEALSSYWTWLQIEFTWTDSSWKCLWFDINYKEFTNFIIYKKTTKVKTMKLWWYGISLKHNLKYSILVMNLGDWIRVTCVYDFTCILIVSVWNIVHLNRPNVYDVHLVSILLHLFFCLYHFYFKLQITTLKSFSNCVALYIVAVALAWTSVYKQCIDLWKININQIKWTYSSTF